MTINDTKNLFRILVKVFVLFLKILQQFQRLTTNKHGIETVLIHIVAIFISVFLLSIRFVSAFIQNKKQQYYRHRV